MEHGDVVAEDGPESGDRLRGESDLRHEDERGFPGSQRRLDDVGIDDGLSRAGHAPD